MKQSGTSKSDPDINHALDLLHRWGIHNIGQLAALDRDAVGRRLGPIGLELWDRASGKTTRLLKLIPPPECFEETFEFENEIETSEPLLFVLRRFLQQLALRLDAVYLVASELRLVITFRDKSVYQHRFIIPEPTTNTEVLFRMLHTHLENFTSAYPIIGLSLEAEPIKGTSQQFQLFETPLRDPARLAETLGRLAALLGADRVGSPVLEETHRPDAFRMEPFTWQLTDKKRKAEPEIGRAKLNLVRSSGLRRFRSALPASMLLEKDRPAHLRTAEISGKVRHRKGPYRISGNWWDNNAWARTEWDLELENGALCRCHSDAGKWEVDGVYD